MLTLHRLRQSARPSPTKPVQAKSKPDQACPPTPRSPGGCASLSPALPIGDCLPASPSTYCTLRRSRIVLPTSFLPACPCLLPTPPCFVRAVVLVLVHIRTASPASTRRPERLQPPRTLNSRKTARDIDKPNSGRPTSLQQLPFLSLRRPQSSGANPLSYENVGAAQSKRLLQPILLILRRRTIISGWTNSRGGAGDTNARASDTIER